MSAVPRATREVRHRVADAAGIPAAAGERDEPLGLLGDHEATDRGVGDQRLGDLGDLRHVDPAPVEKRPAAERGVEAQSHRRRRRHAHHGFTVALQGDQRRPGLVAADEAPGPVDRVDHPAPGRVAIADDPELLADDRVVGPLGADPLADVGLDRPIGLGHRARGRASRRS